MDFEKICMMFTMQEPYYGILLSSMLRKEIHDPRIMPTIGVAKTGNTFMLGYNPDFLSKMNVDETLLLLKHECLHLALNHLTMWGDENNVSPEEHKVRNIAEDLEVNCYLDRSILRDKTAGMWCEDFGFDKYLGARAYYKLLTTMQQQQTQQAQSPSKPCNGGQGGQQQNQQQSQGQSQNQNQNQGNPTNGNSGNGQGQPQQNNGQGNSSGSGKGSIPLTTNSSFDDHSMWPTTETQEQAELMQQTIDDLLVFAAEEVEKGRGSIPGELAGRIKALRDKKKPKPVADWKRFFRRYLGNEFTEQIRKSKKRESRRFPDAAGNRHRRKSHILVGIDTSGSVSMPEYREFLGQIKTLTQTATFHVVECDARIQHEYEFKGTISDTLHGGGGTDFQPVIDIFNKNQRKYDALVYFTDGWCDIPKDTPKDTLWVISSKGDQRDRKKYQVNGAKVAFIPKTDK